MSMVMLIICLVSGGSALVSFLLNRLKPTKKGHVFTVISIVAAIISGVLSYYAGVETEEQIQLAHTQATEASEQADRAQVQITEIRTPRRMESETERMLATRLKPFAGQKYDMLVFRDQDSLELAPAIQAIMEEAGWVNTNVYPRNATRYAETREDGVWLISGMVESRRTSAARMALHGALNEAGLYDDSSAFTSKYCVEIAGPPQVGAQVTRIPCSESSIQTIDIDFIVRDDVIPEDTLVLHIGKVRL